MNSMNRDGAPRSAAMLIAAWLLVTVPAVWGVSQTIHKSLALFTSVQPTADATAPVAPAAPGQSSGH